MAQVQRHPPPAAAGARDGGGRRGNVAAAGAGLRCAHARHDQVLALEDVVPRPVHQGHDGRRGHQAAEVNVIN